MSSRKIMKPSLAKILNDNATEHKRSAEIFKAGAKRKLRIDEDDELETSIGLTRSNDIVQILNKFNSQISDVLNASKAKSVGTEYQKTLYEHRKCKEKFESELKAMLQKFLSDHEKAMMQREKKIEQILKETKTDEQKLTNLYAEFLEKLQNDFLSSAEEVDEKYKRFFDKMKKYMEKDVEKEIKRILNENKHSK